MESSQPEEKPLSAEQWEQATALIRAALPTLDLRKIFFEKQLPFGLEKARFSTAVCTRRAGKTYGCAGRLLEVALRKPGCTALYITQTRGLAKRILWDTLLELNSLFELGGVPNHSELVLRMPNTSSVYLCGAHTEAEVEKFRGIATGIVLIDEGQKMPQFIKKMIDEVLAPGTMDFDGAIVLVGTPGPVPIGYFHECATSPEWAHHSWSVMDNPHILRKSGKTPRQLLDEELKRRGVTEEDPVIQREWFGKWMLDPNALVFRWSDFNGRPAKHHANHAIGLDFGWDDSDAIGVIGWDDDSPEIDLVYEWVGDKQTISKLIERVEELNKRFNPLAIVADTGGLGKKIAEEIQARTGLAIEAADKQRKNEHIELLNDAMRTKRMFAPKDSRFAHDCMLVEWDKSNPEKPVISDRFHSDICDAVLYVWRRALAWLFVPPEKPSAKPQTPEWFAEETARILEAEEESEEEEFADNRRRSEEDWA